ncbi:MAG: leucine-rich repeat protein [Ruminococcus sp.]
MKKRYRTFLVALMSLTLFSTNCILLPVNAEEQGVVSDATSQDEEEIVEDEEEVTEDGDEIIEVDGLRYKETDDYMLLCGVADTSVTSITIPATVNGMAVSIQNGDRGRAFEYCENLENFYVDEDNSSLCSVDGVVFSKDMTTLISYPSGRAGSYTVPEGVQYIDRCAFRLSKKITEVVLPKSIIEIGNYAFQSCSNLKEIVNPAPFKYMTAISGCYSLERVELAENLEFFNFDLLDCPSLKELGIPDSTKVSFSIRIEGCEMPILDLSPIQITSENFYSITVETCGAKELILPKTGKMEQLRLSYCDVLQKVEVPEENYFIRGIKITDCPVLRSMRFLNPTFRIGEVLGMSELEGATVEENSNVAFYTDSVSLQTTAEKLGLSWYPLSQEYILYGDVNQDGKVDLTDSIMLSKANSNLIELSEAQQKVADCDANGTVDDNDASILLQFNLMLVTDLPYIEA